MSYKKVVKSNSSKPNEMILNAMQKRRSLAFRAIAKACNIDVKIHVIK